MTGSRPVPAAAILALLTQPVLGQGNSAALYKSKCASCHGADGTASATGKKLGAQDLQSPDVQKMSDADLSASLGQHPGGDPAASARADGG
ncbi:hypothetical protein B4Q13_17750 [Lacticaseibacillus rhamnosus]